MKRPSLESENEIEVEETHNVIYHPTKEQIDLVELEEKTSAETPTVESHQQPGCTKMSSEVTELPTHTKEISTNEPKAIERAKLDQPSISPTLQTSSTTIQKEKMGFIAWDFETTGGRVVSGDVAFAAGFAMGSMSDHLNETIITGKFLLNLKGPIRGDEQSWSKFWNEKGYERRCFDQFWSKNLEVLNNLQDPKLATEEEWCESERKFVEQIQKTLIEAESLFEKVVLVTDTIHFDTVWLSNLLDKYGYPPLNFKRNGKYNGGGIEVDSYKMGVYGVDPKKEKPWEVDPIFKAHFSDSHDHDPEHDAKSILSILFASMVVKNQTQAHQEEEYRQLMKMALINFQPTKAHLRWKDRFLSDSSEKIVTTLMAAGSAVSRTIGLAYAISSYVSQENSSKELLFVGGGSMSSSIRLEKLCELIHMFLQKSETLNSYTDIRKDIVATINKADGTTSRLSMIQAGASARTKREGGDLIVLYCLDKSQFEKWMDTFFLEILSPLIKNGSRVINFYTDVENASWIKNLSSVIEESGGS